jgi:hypothetical protein
MQRRATAILIGLFLVLSSLVTPATPASFLKDVQRALASPEAVLLIGVPGIFLHPETIEDDAVEAQSDWAYYLKEWSEKSAKDRKFKIIVVPITVLAKALQRPVLKGTCATLFVKNRNEGLLFDSHCVPQIDDYDVGTRWLQGTVSPRDIEGHGFKTTAVVARTGK